MKESIEVPKVSELSHDQIMALVARGRAERSRYVAAFLKQAFTSLRRSLHNLLTPATGLRLRHH